MIYLFSQIAISLVLAAIVGAAAGWLAHRARSGKQIDQLDATITRQVQQVNEAQTQVSMLTNDFDDLKQHSENEIAALKQENQKIPALTQNLEKSQLLVNQLMQQHKAEKVELLSENEKLASKAKQASEREKAFTKLQAELDIERRRNQQHTTADASIDTSVDNAKESVSANPLSNAGKVSSATAQSSETQTELPLVSKDEQESDSKSAVAKSGQTVEKVESAQATGNQADNATGNDRVTSSVYEENKTDNKSSAISSRSNQSHVSKPVPSAAETEAELRLLRDQLAEDVPVNKPDNHSGARVHKLAETTVDENELEPMFEKVQQHDDLKQIFGIGPVTEKTLNKLGITAYSQLAELKQHDIEKIAGALQIFPGRIERDNWVGGARAQLEEMLEDL